MSVLDDSTLVVACAQHRIESDADRWIETVEQVLPEALLGNVVRIAVFRSDCLVQVASK
jgi:hypothetical protein